MSPVVGMDAVTAAMARPGLEPVRTMSPVMGTDAVTAAMARPGLEPVRTMSPVMGTDAVTAAMARPGLEPGTPRFQGVPRARRDRRKSPANHQSSSNRAHSAIPFVMRRSPWVWDFVSASKSQSPGASKLRVAPARGQPDNLLGLRRRATYVVGQVPVRCILEVPADPLASIRRVHHGAHSTCGRGDRSARRWSWVHQAGRYEINVLNQVSVAYRHLDMESLAEKRARECGRSLGEHGTYGTDPCAFALEDRNRDFDDHPIKPVSAAGLPGQG
jgi:hypothetical protein